MRDTDIRGPVRERVRVEIESLGITKAALARRTGMSRQALHNKLAGETDFTLPELYEIAKALRVPAASLLPDDLDGAA